MNGFELRRISFKTELWEERSRDTQAGSALLHGLGSLFGGPGVATKKEEGFTVIGKSSGKADAQGGSSDPFGERGTLELTGPDQRHSIGDNEIGVIDEGFVSGKTLAAKQVIKVCSDDIPTLVPMQGIDDVSAGFGFGNRIKGYALQVNFRLLRARIQCHFSSNLLCRSFVRFP